MLNVYNNNINISGEIMIDAQHQSEERYCKLSLAYNANDEEEKILTAIKNSTAICHQEPIIYKSDLINNKKVITVEYHDDINREAGAVFDSILNHLHITKCLV